MHLEIAHPWVLLLVPVFAAVIIGYTCMHEWMAGRAKKQEQKKHRLSKRQIGEMVLRCLVLSLVVLALSGVHIRKSSDMITTIFLMDLSDSVKGVEQEEVQFVRNAIAQMPDKNQAGIVVFGQDAKIEQFISEKKAFTDVQSVVSATATNLEQAVQTAMALFPDDTAKRLVLLTDGEENEGSINNLCSSFGNSDIELKVVQYENTIEEEVYISNVELPDSIIEGSEFEVKVDIYSTEATNATVTLYSGRTFKGQQTVLLQKGNNRLVFVDEGVESGIKSYRVTVDAEKDTVAVNNTYSAFTTVEAPPTLLLVEGEKEESKPFRAILDACNYDYEVVSPSGVPGNISDMLRYQSIILLDVYADDLRSGFLDTLETYVKDYAGGLIVLGGKNSYALGNYRGTSIETVLPVQMDLEGEKEIPKIAMVMVIDHSGSMSASSTEQGNISCMDIAKQAAIHSLDSLREIDEVGVIAFDDTYTWTVPLQAAEDTEAIEEKISGISANGGTSIYPAVKEAVRGLEASDASLKHIVLLTDGQDGNRDYDALVEEMENYGITLSTVAVGTDADSNMLQWLAEQGGGRYYYSDAGTSLPRIFAQEVYLSTQSYLINEEFTPVIVNSHEIIRNIFTEGSPNLLGYVATTAKQTATVILESDRQDPVLAVWQYGLGRTVAWTSDGTNEWTANFAGWDSYAAMWHNIIDWSISNTEVGEDTLSVEQKASSAVITYQTEDYSTATKISAVITDEEGNRQEVVLSATAPGVYQSEVPLSNTGVYSVNVRNQDGDELVKNINTATAMQYSQEYRYAEISGNLGNFMNQVGARSISEVDEVFDTQLKGAVTRQDLTMWLLLAAILCFAADIVFRRMNIDWVTLIGRKLKGLCLSSVFSNKKQKKENSAKEAVRAEVVQEQTLQEQTMQEETVRQAAPQVDSKSAPKEKKQNRHRMKMEEKARKQEEKKKQQDTLVIDTAALLQKKKDREL